MKRKVFAIAAISATVLLFLAYSHRRLVRKGRNFADMGGKSIRDLLPMHQSANSVTAKVFIALRTSSIFHRTRIPPIMKTWFTMAETA